MMIHLVFTAIILPLFLAEFSNLGPWIANKALALASSKVPPAAREDQLAQWQGDIDAAPGSLVKVIKALSILLGSRSAGRAIAEAMRDRHSKLAQHRTAPQTPHELASYSVNTQSAMVPTEALDPQEHSRLRRLMWASVQRAWRGNANLLSYPIDPWHVVDDAWISMAKNEFRHVEPFPVFACRMAREQALAALLVVPAHDFYAQPFRPLRPRPFVDPYTEYLEADRLASVSEAIHLLSPIERWVFFAVKVDKRSNETVGAELHPPLTGSQLGEVLDRALHNIYNHLNDRHRRG